MFNINTNTEYVPNTYNYHWAILINTARVQKLTLHRSDSSGKVKSYNDAIKYFTRYGKIISSKLNLSEKKEYFDVIIGDGDCLIKISSSDVETEDMGEEITSDSDEEDYVCCGEHIEVSYLTTNNDKFQEIVDYCKNNIYTTKPKNVVYVMLSSSGVLIFSFHVLSF